MHRNVNNSIFNDTFNIQTYIQYSNIHSRFEVEVLGQTKEGTGNEWEFSRQNFVRHIEISD